LFRSMAYRSYEAFEEDDEKGEYQVRVANPAQVAGWLNIKPGLDYSKLDARGIVKVGEHVDQNTVIVGRYLRSKSGQYRDASVTPQVWTRGRVEKIAITVSNTGMRLVKIRVVHDRIPELGDKFSNRHGQKGTIGMTIRGHDMPRTIDGIVPDMIMNPHAIPSRMTIAQLLETIFGKAATRCGAIANGTAFMNDGDPTESIGDILEKEFGLERYGNEILYDGTTGVQIPSAVFIGQCYTMRLKHMTEDKWNARGQGRREQRTHQPTGGRGNEGGLRIGEMERDAITGHGMSLFTRESYMKRGDGTQFVVCNGCGTIPIYNEKDNFYVCPLCDGPVKYAGDSASNLELLPPNKRSLATFSKVEFPYVVKLLEQELSTYMNIGLRFLTAKNVTHLRQPPLEQIDDAALEEYINMPLPEMIIPETRVVEYVKPVEELVARPEDLAALGAPIPMADPPLEQSENEVIAQEMDDIPLQVEPLQTIVAQNVIPTTVPVGSMMMVPANQNFVQQQPPMYVQQQQQQPQMFVQQQQQQPQMYVQQPAMNYVPVMTAPQMLGPPIPGAPPTLVVDTSPQAMAASGFEPRNNQAPQQSGGNRRRTQRNSRPSQGGYSYEPPQQQQQQQQQSNNATARITVQKLGV